MCNTSPFFCGSSFFLLAQSAGGSRGEKQAERELERESLEGRIKVSTPRTHVYSLHRGRSVQGKRRASARVGVPTKGIGHD